MLSYGASSTSDEEFERVEQMRLLRYYKHRFCTFIQIMKESVTARRVKGPQKRVIAQDEEEKGGAVKVFSLKP